LAKHIVKLNVQDLQAVFNGAIRALAIGRVFGKGSPAWRMAPIWKPPRTMPALAR
jgi:hypothetical protein